MRDVLKLWRDDFATKVTQWFINCAVLLELGVIRNDEGNGWVVRRMGRGAEATVTAEHIFETCVVCAARGKFRRCPCSKKMRYCGTACRDLGWEHHKAEHKRKMAKRAAKKAAAAADGAPTAADRRAGGGEPLRR